MIKYSVLNKSLDIWEKENLTKQEALNIVLKLEEKERRKAPDEWKYEFEIREVSTQ